MVDKNWKHPDTVDIPRKRVVIRKDLNVGAVAINQGINPQEVIYNTVCIDLP